MVRFRGHTEDRDYTALDLTLLRRIWPFIAPYRLAFAACLLMLLASFGLEALRPYLMRLAIDGPVRALRAGAEGGYGGLYEIGAWFLGSALLSVVLGYGYTWTTTLNAQRVIRDVRARVYRHLLEVSPRYFDRHPAGKLVTRVTSDVENLNELIATGVLQTAFDLLKVFGLLVTMLVVHWQLALFLCAAIPVMVVTSLWFRRYARESFRAVRGAQARLNGFAAEAVGGVASTRVFGREDLVQAHFDELNDETKQAWLDTVFHFSLFFSIVDMVVHLTQAGLVYLGGSLILDGGLTFGEFVQFWLYSALIAEPVKQLGEKYNVLQSAFASSERIFQILDQPVDPVPPAHPRPSGAGPAEVRCEGLRFAYREGQPVLDGVDFCAPPGSTVAVVGPTGAGKSTLLSMLSRLQDPDAGTVRLDGVDVRELSLHELRRRIAVVQQDVFLFKGTILDNVRLFDESIDEQRVREALDATGALGFVEARGGVHAAIEERGATLSQGERQLLSFARALAFDPDVLILDEATASIDTHSEQRIQAALARLLHDRTCIVVAHRLSTVREADEILVMRQGRIVERGDHAALVAAGGLYAAMLRHAIED